MRGGLPRRTLRGNIVARLKERADAIAQDNGIIAGQARVEVRRTFDLAPFRLMFRAMSPSQVRPSIRTSPTVPLRAASNIDGQLPAPLLSETRPVSVAVESCPPVDPRLPDPRSSMRSSRCFAHHYPRPGDRARFTGVGSVGLTHELSHAGWDASRD